MKKCLLTAALGVCIFAAAAPVRAGQTFEITNAIHTSENSTEAKAAVLFKELVEKRSNGAVTVNNFPGGVLGTELENLGQLKSGEVEMTVPGAVGPQQIIPEYDATNVPFAFPSVEEVEKYWNGPVGAKIRALMIERNNARLLAMLRRGPRNLTANKAITNPAELAGLKLRIPEISSWVKVWKAMGALPTPVNWSEVYTALQTRVVDAQENPIETIYTGKVNEVQSHLMLTEHLYLHYFFCINEAFYNKLPPEYRKIVDESAQEAIAWGNDFGAKYERELLEKMQKEGMTIVTVDKQVFMDAGKAGVLDAVKDLTPEAREVVMGYLK